MAWWNFWTFKSAWERAVEQAEADSDLDLTDFDNAISEPIKSIVSAIISDRKRFIIDRTGGLLHTSPVKYEILDMDTDEIFKFSTTTDVHYYGIDTYFEGPSWARQHELKWAHETICSHYMKLNSRAKRINAIRERNRLIEIYA